MSSSTPDGLPAGVPTGWPAVQRPSRRRVRWWRAGVLFIALCAVGETALFILDTLDRQRWQWAAVIAGLLLITAGLTVLWRMAPRPWPTRSVQGSWSGLPKDRARVLRRALLHGDPISPGQLPDVAALAAGATRIQAFAAIGAAVAGNSAFTVAQGQSGVGHWFSAITSAIVVLGLSVVVIEAWRLTRIERAAAALGAVPILINGN